MKKNAFGRTGFDVSVLGFGAAPAAFLKTDAVAVINALLDQGLNLLDTATGYPGSQEFIGDNFAHRRQDYVLISKCGHKVQGIDAGPWSEKVIAHSVDLALEQLKTDHIDAMLLHSCDLKTLESGEAIGALVKARDAGKIKFVGYSGDNEAATFAANHPEIAVLETSINIVDQVNIDAALEAARKNNLGVLAKRPIANACWKDLKTQPGMYQSYAATYTERFAKMGLTPADLGFDGPPEEAWPEIALRFTLSQPGVSCAIVGTTKLENAERNMATSNKGPLQPVALNKLREAFKAANPDSRWNGET